MNSTVCLNLVCHRMVTVADNVDAVDHFFAYFCLDTEKTVILAYLVNVWFIHFLPWLEATYHASIVSGILNACCLCCLLVWVYPYGWILAKQGTAFQRYAACGQHMTLSHSVTIEAGLV